MDEIEKKLKALESSIIAFNEELDILSSSAKKLFNRIEELHKSIRDKKEKENVGDKTEQ